MNAQPAESDLRRRAAWLLAMIAVVAVLFVVLMTTLLSSGNASSSGSGPDDGLGPNTTSSAPTSHTATTPRPRSHPSSPRATSTCPDSTPCALQGDSGNAIAAINAYRVQHGRQKLTGTVSKAAQACALSNGSRSACTGGWAESQVSKLDGAAAVAKIARLGKLLDQTMRSFQVGWAFAPASKSYYFAVIRTD